MAGKIRSALPARVVQQACFKENRFFQRTFQITSAGKFRFSEQVFRPLPEIRSGSTHRYHRTCPSKENRFIKRIGMKSALPPKRLWRGRQRSGSREKQKARAGEQPLSAHTCFARSHKFTSSSSCFNLVVDDAIEFRSACANCSTKMKWFGARDENVRFCHGQTDGRTQRC